MAKTKDQITTVIDDYMQKFSYKNSDWYVGIAADPRSRLFSDHNVDEQNGYWIYEIAESADVARKVEQAYIDTGHDGGAGGGDDDSVYVYAYVKLKGTAR